ncbi:hypothetical protein CIG75_12850 [Tumebacillus algifaecis]|uniref:Uncharacterized protein n=1 Tax=Tumebacillus algifaecis TaxID=1214604 RepID=A0A223D318_9BACL|nr:DUF1878 family protein [Tumebacillus algifaecis]ASS75787.1 hypothetical protein CIG75_12850 [Tumebacillus algifaecis]
MISNTEDTKLKNLLEKADFQMDCLIIIYGDYRKKELEEVKERIRVIRDDQALLMKMEKELEKVEEDINSLLCEMDGTKLYRPEIAFHYLCVARDWDKDIVDNIFKICDKYQDSLHLGEQINHYEFEIDLEKELGFIHHQLAETIISTLNQEGLYAELYRALIKSRTSTKPL